MVVITSSLRLLLTPLSGPFSGPFFFGRPRGCGRVAKPLAVVRSWTLAADYVRTAGAVGRMAGLSANHPLVCRRAGHRQANGQTPGPARGQPWRDPDPRGQPRRQPDRWAATTVCRLVARRGRLPGWALQLRLMWVGAGPRGWRSGGLSGLSRPAFPPSWRGGSLQWPVGVPGAYAVGQA
eukprot:55400-Chlamydomonas_euryale.AAC.8